MSPTITNDRLLLRFPSRRILLGRLEKDSDKVDVTSTAYDDMWVNWELIDDLTRGRDQMIFKAQRWLPQEPLEKAEAYNVRLERSFLFNAYKNALNDLSSKPFSREVIIRNEEKVPARLLPMFANIDQQGTSLTAFAKKMFYSGLKYGHTLVFVDFPKVGEGLSILEEERLGALPFWNLIDPPDFIGWDNDVIRGIEMPVRVRFRQTRIRPKGEFGDRREEIIRVVSAPPAIKQMLEGDGDVPEEMRRGMMATWVRNRERNDFELESVTTHSYPGVPIFWMPIAPKELFVSEVPLQDLAEMNLAHWQSSSDARNILRFVSIAMLFLSGVDEDSGGTPDDTATGGPSDVAWGVNQILRGPKGSDGKYIEHSGSGLGALQEEIKQIEARMESLGTEPMMSRQPDVTATAQANDKESTTSILQSWVRALEWSLQQGAVISARWIGEDLPIDKDTGVSFDAFNEFGLKVSDRSDSDQLLRARTAGELSKKLFLNEWKKRGLIGEEVDIDEEIGEQEEEMPVAAAGIEEPPPDAPPPGEPPPDEEPPPDGAE